VIIFTLVCLSWGSIWLAVKVGLRFLPPFTFAGISFATPVLGLLLIAKLLHARFPKDRSSWIAMIFLGIIGIGASFGFTFWGEQYVSSGLSAVLFGTAPFFVVIFAHFLIEEQKVTRWKILGIAISFAGMLAIFWHQLTFTFTGNTQSSLYGAFAEVASAACAAMGIIIYKRFCAEIDNLVTLLVQTVVGSVFLLFLGLVWETSSIFDFSPLAIAAIICLGLGTTLPFIGYYWLLEKTTVINVSMTTFITPILALFLGWILLGEQLAGNTLLGAMLILTGLYLTVGFVNYH